MSKSCALPRILVIAITALSLISIIFASVLHAGQVTLCWDPVVDPYLAGYLIHYGTHSENYDTSVNVGNWTSATIAGIEEDQVYYFAVTAYGIHGEKSVFSNEVVWPNKNFTEVIIDNGGPGTSSTGRWQASGSLNYYVTKSVYSKDPRARYIFTANVNGYQNVSVWWTWYSSRCRNVQLDLFNDNTLLDIVYLDQADESQGGIWNLLGTYSFSGTARVVIHAQGRGCSTCADAVKFVKR